MSLQMKRTIPSSFSTSPSLPTSLYWRWRALSLKSDAQLMDGQVEWDPEWLAPWLWSGLAAAGPCECPHPLHVGREAWEHGTWTVNRWTRTWWNLRAEFGSLCVATVTQGVIGWYISAKESSSSLWFPEVTLLLRWRYPNVGSYIFLTHLSCFILTQILQCS